MKLLFDFLPLLLFYIAFKFYGIYVATAVLMVVSFLQIGIYWLKHRRLEKLPLITLVMVLFFGGITLAFHNDMFIKWKFSVLYWLLALCFLGSQFIGKKNLVQRMLDKQMTLPPQVWRRLNHSWVLFFLLMGFVNVYVLYHFSTNAWVNFKFFGAFGLTVAFLIVQFIYMSRYLEAKNDSGPFTPSLKKTSPDEH
jgi:intracellular septation protein